MDYISVKEAASIWGISERRVRALCADGRIEGAARHGDWAWSIPKDTPRPTDGRSIRYVKNEEFRAGAQNYSPLVSVRDYIPQEEDLEITAEESAVFAVSLDAIDLSEEQSESILSGIALSDVPLVQQVYLLNVKTALYDCFKEPMKLDEFALKSLNEKLLNSVLNTERGKFVSDEKKKQFQAAMRQLRIDWAALNPAARAMFLMGEILRIKPFVFGNGAIAVICAQNVIREAGYPPASITSDVEDELKAALASTSRRGNYQKAIEVFIKAISCWQDR